MRNNGYGSASWDAYIAALEGAPPAVVAIGITDYCSIDGYKKVNAFRAAGRLTNIPLIIPNVEFRLTIPTGKGAGVNAHLLFSPNDDDHIERIEALLSDIRMEFHGGHSFRCTRTDLIRLGRRTKPELVNDDAAYAEGNLQFKLEISTIRKILQDSWVRKNCLVGFSNSDYDGVSVLARSPSFAAIRDDIYQIAHFIFSATPADRAYFLGSHSTDTPDVIVRRYGGLKPCLHGCDAHNFEKLFEPDRKRYCWIKADPTFSGLKQILYEPDDRVWIGETPQLNHDRARVVRAISLESPSRWFATTHIPLNSGLIAVIGEKGGGKSALAELIAYACGSWYPDNRKSFLERAASELSGTQITLDWLDDSTSTASFTLGHHKSAESGRARYLSQRFVEQLCSEDITADSLVAEIENVIFAHLSPQEKLGASSFTDLRTMRTKRFVDQRHETATAIQECIVELDALRSNAKSLTQKNAAIETLAAEAASLKKQMPVPADEEGAKLEEAISHAQADVASTQEHLSRQNTVLVEIENIESKTAIFRRSMDRFNDEVGRAMRSCGFSDDDIAIANVGFRGDVNAVIAARKAFVIEQIRQLTGSDDDMVVDTLRYKERRLAEIEARRSSDQSLREKAARIQKRLSEIAQVESRLREDIERINTIEKERIAELRSALTSAYINYFIKYEDELAVLKSLYEPVGERLKIGKEQEKSLSFDVRWHIDFDAWISRGAAIFDARRSQPFGTFGAMEERLRNELLPRLSAGEKDKIIAAMDEIFGVFLDSNLETISFLKGAYKFKDLIEWLFDVQHISLRYGLRYDDVPLENLSPGSKGIVLLILYLGIDREDNRPIIIDQPEENLDNWSVYSLLREYFRKAKKYRQIIVITHNPNLVVGTDADQIIVAKMKRGERNVPIFEYESGSLEYSKDQPPGIREQVCGILEGGEEAFAKRESIYGVIAKS